MISDDGEEGNYHSQGNGLRLSLGITVLFCEERERNRPGLGLHPITLLRERGKFENTRWFYGIRATHIGIGL